MIRNPEGMTPELLDAAIRVEQACVDAGFELLIYCTFRSLEKQARLYRQGRTIGVIEQKAKQLSDQYGRPDLAEKLMNAGPQYGKYKVTYAGPGQSYHNYKLAFDAVPMRDGKPVWKKRLKEDKALWLIYGQAVTDAGLEWAGNWTRGKEYPHAQMPGFDWKKLICGAD